MTSFAFLAGAGASGAWLRRVLTLVAVGAAAAAASFLTIRALTEKPPAVAAAAAPPAPQAGFAPAQPDARQVRAAYQEVGRLYGDSGGRELAAFAAACPQLVAARPAQLDFCLAFIQASATLGPPATAPSSEGPSWSFAEQLALARSALPANLDPLDRIAAVQALAIEMGIAPAQRGAPPPHAKAVHHRRHGRPTHRAHRAAGQSPDHACRTGRAARGHGGCSGPPTAPQAPGEVFPYGVPHAVQNSGSTSMTRGAPR